MPQLFLLLSMVLIQPATAGWGASSPLYPRSKQGASRNDNGRNSRVSRRIKIIKSFLCRFRRVFEVRVSYYSVVVELLSLYVKLVMWWSARLFCLVPLSRKCPSSTRVQDNHVQSTSDISTRSSGTTVDHRSNTERLSLGRDASLVGQLAVFSI